ncbi:hypothetical protein HQN89_28625 [Paenibacillus frigoriresistens]|uniref:hypothetical protein n=1 Tax=Paenibacillus alginolyticus TaxID=59839 RepID=UPI001564474F|nr:hypothetical protein [Paenibacillus frigoriresistens]NRF94859.1 hypothetical protein [Paenibacillus frigoriresistens]
MSRFRGKDRIWVILSLGITLIIVLFGLWTMFHTPSVQWHDRSFKGLFKNYGSQARILLFAVLAYYVLKAIIQRRWVDQWLILKKIAIALLKVTRKFHTPIAILAIGVIFLHIVGAFLYGIKLDFANISGLLAGLALLPVPIAGVFRARGLDRKWHLRLGLIFAVLFLIHAFL